MSLRVVHLHRQPAPGHFSIERLFNWVRMGFPPSIDLVVAECPRLSQGLKNRWQNVRWAAQQQGDILHITGDVHYLALGTPRHKTILTIHDVVFLQQAQGWRRWLLWLFWVYWPVQQAGLVTVISNASACSLKAVLPATLHKKIRVISNCVDPHLKFLPKTELSTLPRILLIGTMNNKNQLRQLEALRTLDVDIHLIGHENANLRTFLANYPHTVQWDQGVSDQQMQQAYLDCDLLLFASLEEGFGLPILEAQAVGRPVISSHCSSMPEVAGEGACLIDPQNTEAIREAVQRILADPAYRQQLIANGQKNVQRFSPDRVAQAYLAVYQELLQQT